MPDVAIEAVDIAKRFDDVEALCGVSFAVPTGTVLGLLGPNGAGKTTAVRILTTLLTADAGRAEVLGLDVRAEAARVRASIGLAGQNAAVDENLTGAENLQLVGRLTHLPAEEIASRTTALLETFDLADAGDRLVRTYSGGMRRRIDLAAALVHRPPVLFLDEPTTGLDPRSRTDLWVVIEELVAAGTTVLLTTQYLEEADRLTDRIVVVDHGTVIAEGTSAELKARLGATVIEVGFATSSVASDAAASLQGIGSVSVDGSQVKVTVEAGASAMFDIFQVLAAHRLEPVDLALHEPTLDDVFLTLTGHAAEDTDESADDSGSRRARTAERGMTTEVVVRAQPAPPVRVHAVSDAITIAWRNVLNLRRNPQLLVFATIQPIVFVLMFRYVFGGAIAVPGGSYVNYLMPGIFVQTVVFGSLTTGVGLADDLQLGIIDRFRSLPMARSAVLVGRTLADLLRNTFVVILMAVVGVLVGWRPDGNPAEIAFGLFLVLAFAYSLSWLFAIVGLSVRDGETAQAMSFPIIAPLVFASSAFVPVESMPGWLQVFAEHQPVSAVCDAVRGLTLGIPDTSNVLQAIAWIVGIVAICAPFAVRRYRRAV